MSKLPALKRLGFFTRLLDENFHALLDGGVADSGASWQDLVALLGDELAYLEHYDEYTADNVSEWVLWHRGNANAVAAFALTRVNMGGGIVNHAKLSEYYGYAHENVTRVVLRLPGGAEYGAQTFAAWPGSGLRLWAFAVPSSALPAKPRQDVLVGYDAADHAIWSGL